MERLSSKGEMLSQIELKGLPHSAFDMRNHNFMSGKLGKIIPTRVDEVYPGDKIKGDVQAVVNFEPLAAPIMGSMVLKQESFYVPYSIIWKNAHNFFTGKKGYDESMPTISPAQIYSHFCNFRTSAQSPYIHLIPTQADIYDPLVELIDKNNDGTLTPSLLDDSLDIIYDQFNACANALVTFGTKYFVADLLWPVRKKIYDFIETPSGATESVFLSLYTKLEDLLNDGQDLTVTLKELIKRCCDILEYIHSYFFGASSLGDYLGWPTNPDWSAYYNAFYEYVSNPDRVTTPETPDFTIPSFSQIPLNFMPFRAAYICWYWNYRDQLLEAEAYDPETDDFQSDIVTPLQAVLCFLLRVRCWYKDTYTTALTNTGDGNFRVPIADGSALSPTGTDIKYFDGSGALVQTTDAAAAQEAGATIMEIEIGSITYKMPINYLGVATNELTAQTTTADASLSLDLFDRIKRLRTFVQKRLVLGYEYDDVIWSSFMVRLSNVRMRIPELLSRGRDAVDINTIVNNTNIPDGQIAGDKTAVAWAQGKSSHIDYFVEEHGLFMSFMTILPVQSYSGGMSRLYLKKDRFDFMWPEFATMGMDAVYNAELAAPVGAGVVSGVGLDDVTAMAVFGYQGRYYDLKSKKDEEHGRLRTDLNYLTFSREFSDFDKPVLNYWFVHCWPSLDMFVTDDPNVDVFRGDIYHAIDISRCLPVASEYIG